MAKLANLPVFDPIGDQVGKVRDIVSVTRITKRPRIVGMVIEVPGKRKVFMPMSRVTSLDAEQIITTGIVNMRRFEKRSAETLMLGEMLDRPVVLKATAEDAAVEDLSIKQTRSGDWELSKVFVRKGKPTTGITGRFRRSGETLLVNLDEIDGLATRPADGQGAAALIASLDGMKAADVAERLKDLPEIRRREIVAELPDDQLADVVEELGEEDQVAILRGLSQHRAADVLEAMQPDDAADVLGELPDDQQERLLRLMEPQDAKNVRHLLSYDEYTAGGLMTTLPVLLSPENSIAEGLALLRRRELSPTIAAAAFVCRPPLETPTGKFLGVVHIQRMLRHAPGENVGAIMDSDIEALPTDAPLSSVTRLMATYNLVSIPVTNPQGQLVGVVTVDDVLDHLLPDDWRDTEEIPSDPKTGEVTLTTLHTPEGGTRG